VGPSVKSLVNFPTVARHDERKARLDADAGDAVLAQQKDVMAAVQRLRKKAYDTGNLKSSKELTVKVDTAYQVAQPSGEGAPTPAPPQEAQQPQQVIVIQSTNPQVVYVPAYNPTVVYGAWAYPAYPPYPVYPAYYAPGAALFSFGVGVAVGAAWGYAWGGCGWGRGDIDVDVNRNTNINNNINRSNYQNKVTGGERGQGQGQWKHNPESRKGVAYRDQNTANKFNKGHPRAQARETHTVAVRTQQVQAAVRMRDAVADRRLAPWIAVRGQEETVADRRQAPWIVVRGSRRGTAGLGPAQGHQCVQWL